MATAAEVMIHPVQSSNISGIGYVDAEKTLVVHFKNGNKYFYLDVPREAYETLRKAESIGRFFHGNIRLKYKSVNMTE